MHNWREHTPSSLLNLLASIAVCSYAIAGCAQGGAGLIGRVTKIVIFNPSRVTPNELGMGVCINAVLIW